MTVSNVGDRRSYEADTDEGFDQQGYCLTQGDDGGETVKKATSGDPFLGTNFRSTLDEQDEEVLTGGGTLGAQVAVEQDGVVNMLCAAGSEYNPGDTVSLSDEPGIADNVADTGGTGTDDTVVGTVVRYYDLTDADGPELVPVEITGQLGGN